MPQKFFHGDVVRVLRTENPMRTLPSGSWAIVLGSYADLYHGQITGEPSYSILFVTGADRGHEISWFPESELSFEFRKTPQEVRRIRDDFAAERSERGKAEKAKEGLVPDENFPGAWRHA